jgi:CarD family transcriptional regulator
MFRIGDKILHPLHGVGVIEAIADQQVFGKIHKYYMVNLTMKNMKVMVPVDNADEIGVRKIIKSEVIDDVLLDLKSKKTSEMPANWNRRYKHNLEKIKTGDVHEVAEVLRNLYLKDRRKGLSMGEKKMLDNAMQLLIGEIVCAKKMTAEKAKATIVEALH